MTKRIITIEVAKTVQVAQYEPVTVKVTETIEVEADSERAKEIRLKLYTGVTKSVKQFIDNEVLKYKEENKKSKK
jgi:hypothetical protein